MRFARIDQSPVARWWWTVDRWSLAALSVLMGFGVVMSLAASPAVAERIGYDALHFVRRYLALLPVTIALDVRSSRCRRRGPSAASPSSVSASGSCCWR